MLHNHDLLKSIIVKKRRRYLSKLSLHDGVGHSKKVTGLLKSIISEYTLICKLIWFFERLTWKAAEHHKREIQLGSRKVENIFDHEEIVFSFPCVEFEGSHCGSHPGGTVKATKLRVILDTAKEWIMQTTECASPSRFIFQLLHFSRHRDTCIFVTHVQFPENIANERFSWVPVESLGKPN
ncbi:hypothetical protein T265_11087 [Opisthorchis viverrini]|uniref:Uncharacterized protein n=1 Tax=Opisthorchis viverrini TaxID=6198 RepID=A0A074Z493_OPIVI|nr:hypothetical protein T265_11087 [Opisthorchis viverrini]KER20337.1 hypothetical protein T265_11087 [Opisthorchis viverrini]